MRNKRRSAPTYNSPNGPQQAANEMVNQLASIFNGSIRNQRLPPAPSPHNTPLDPQQYPSPFSRDTVFSALKKLPNGKAPGPDHLRAEIIKTTTAVMVPLLQSFFSICWYWSKTSAIWCQAQVIPIYKKGDPHNAANYRPISLTSDIRILIYFDRGDTKSPFCKKESNESRLDLRIVSSHARTAPDLCVSEHAKKAAP